MLPLLSLAQRRLFQQLLGMQGFAAQLMLLLTPGWPLSQPSCPQGSLFIFSHMGCSGASELCSLQRDWGLHSCREVGPGFGDKADGTQQAIRKEPAQSRSQAHLQGLPALQTCPEEVSTKGLVERIIFLTLFSPFPPLPSPFL